LWPGVGMMVTSSLTSFAFSWRSVVAAIRGTGRKRQQNIADATEVDDGGLSRAWYLRALAVALVIATVAQVLIFGISLWLAVFAVFFTFLLAIVAGRVSGETAITPVGPMGKVTQLVVGVMSPGDPVGNLMAANVTGGAASQTGDMLHDLKAGHLIGAKARLQGLSQTLGILGGALVGSAAYLVLIPDPSRQLLTAEWPAPAAAAWKAVAEVFSEGLHAMPPGTQMALLVAGVLGVVLALLEKLLPERARRFVPSPASIGLAFIVPAWNSISMFLGAVLAVVARKVAPKWSAAFLIVVAAGVIAGESLTGVLIAVQKIFAAG
ncbi:MAG TPA: OPT/YSL family transporter, partial [Myxococcaceae bacterium]|nr:OPT/YSL family transporter [Myxococcaceae bacterium]